MEGLYRPMLNFIRGKCKRSFGRSGELVQGEEFAVFSQGQAQSREKPTSDICHGMAVRGQGCFFKSGQGDREQQDVFFSLQATCIMVFQWYGSPANKGKATALLLSSLCSRRLQTVTVYIVLAHTTSASAVPEAECWSRAPRATVTVT